MHGSLRKIPKSEFFVETGNTDHTKLWKLADLGDCLFELHFARLRRYVSSEIIERGGLIRFRRKRFESGSGVDF